MVITHDDKFIIAADAGDILTKFSLKEKRETMWWFVMDVSFWSFFCFLSFFLFFPGTQVVFILLVFLSFFFGRLALVS